MKFDKMNLSMVGVVLAILGVGIAEACTYSYYGYDRCNNVPCSYDSQCSSYNCFAGYCSRSSELPPWAIAMIVIFSVMFFFSIVGAACKRRRQ